MRLLIISHTAHFAGADAPVAWGPTVREIDHLATLFDSVTHIAPMHTGAPPPSAIRYASPAVRHVAVRPAGGSRLADKLGIVARAPGYLRAILRELGRCDVVHVRCPANISLLAVVVLFAVRRPRLRWIKYAGNWRPPLGTEPLSYRLQRWLLARAGHGARVTVNGVWPGDPPHVRAFRNPCLTDDELDHGRAAARDRTMSSPIRLVFVGRLERAKGVGRALRTVGLLADRGVPATLDLVGDGPERAAFEREAAELGVGARVRFHGWLARPDLNAFYGKAHLLLLPSACSEGWPKVISEGMAYGVVPVVSDVSSVRQYLHEARTGTVVARVDEKCFADAVARYAASPALWKCDSARAVVSARRFGYREYLGSVVSLLELGSPSSPSEPARATAAVAAARQE